MKKLNTLKLRKHPGGLRGFISSFRTLIPLTLLVWGLLTIGSLVNMVSTTRTVNVVCKECTLNKLPVVTGQIAKIKSIGIYTFSARNVFDWLLFPGEHFPDIFTCLFTLLILWYLLRVFKALELDSPFSFKIAGYINKLGWIIIAGWVFAGLREIYMSYSIKSLTDDVYKFNGSIAGYSLGMGIIILIIAAVYKRGCELQEDKELTI